VTIPSIVDAHLHLWDPALMEIGWLRGNELLDRPYSLDDFDEAAGGLTVDGLVFVQAEVARPYAFIEADWAAALAADDPRLQAIVAWAPLEYGERARFFVGQLGRLLPVLKGIRRNLQDEPDPDFCLRKEFVRGVQLLADYDLSFDICVRADQLPAVRELVRQCPTTRFVLDHLGKPDVARERLEPWRTDLGRLAESANVWCKISGLATEAAPTWTSDDLRPFVGHAIGEFGAERIMFGSDWPVASQATSYGRWVATLDELTTTMSTPDRQRFWRDNARAFYRLGSPS
jgi:L-fuconolactonase